MISVILLSAGSSSRFGSPKALVDLDGKTAIQCLQKTLIESMVAEIIVVLGAHRQEINPYILKHKKVQVVYNKDYNLGQTSSFKAGLSSMSSQAFGIMLLPVDYPFIKVATIDFLCAEFLNSSQKIVVPSYQNKKGHPPIFASGLKKEFMSLENSQGLNQIAHKHHAQVKIVSTEDAGVVATFNTQDDLAKLRGSL